MSWKEIFKNYPKDMVKYGLMGVCETIKLSLVCAKSMDKEKYIKTLEEILKGVEKDLEEIRR